MKRFLRNTLFLSFSLVGLIACTDDDISGRTDTGSTDTDSKTEYNNGKIDQQIFAVLNLDYAGLSSVKSSYEAEEYYAAAQSLLDYYRTRLDVVHPEVTLAGFNMTPAETEMADKSLKLQFYADNGYLDCSVDDKLAEIKWPFEDGKNEAIYQLHRHKWFTPLAKMYRSTMDSKYAEAWIKHYSDWMESFPVPEVKLNYDRNPGSDPGNKVNLFVWRPLEASHRLKAQCEIFHYFNQAKEFTPEILCEFLISVAEHVDHIVENYSATSNHLISQAQSVVYAACQFPEMKKSEQWLSSGVNVLNNEIQDQVLDDGVHYELDFGYHMGGIDSFRSAMAMAEANGRVGVFPQVYFDIMHTMMVFAYNVTFPNYSAPQFGDTRKASYSKSVLLRNFREFAQLYPSDGELQWMATEGAAGTKPMHLTKAFNDGGYYVMRSGWEASDIMMVLNNGPEGGYHSQPDNGSFELYARGRNFFPDSGVYQYSGSSGTNADRDRFARTEVHNTITLDKKNITGRDGKCLLFENKGNYDVLVTSNQSYEGLMHRRSVFFVSKTFFVIVDEAVGPATGTVNLNFNIGESKDNYTLDKEDNGASSSFPDNSNIIVRTFSPSATTFIEKEGIYSEQIEKSVDRYGWSIDVVKASADEVRYITVIFPYPSADAPVINGARFTDGGYSESAVSLEVGIEGRAVRLEYSL